VWFFENGEAASTELLLPFIEENPALEFVESFPDGRDSRFFWMVTRRRPDPGSRFRAEHDAGGELAVRVGG